MKPEVRAALDAIEEILLRNAHVGRDLWAVLTALRGPDEAHRDGDKIMTTAIIRRAAFPRLPDSAYGANGALIANHIQPIPLPSSDYSHFDWHVYHAALALDVPLLKY